MLPNSIVSSCVNDGKNYNCIRPNKEENAIREPSSEDTAYSWTSPNTRKRFRTLQCSCDSRMYFRKKLQTKTRLTAVIPLSGISEVRLSFWSDD